MATPRHAQHRCSISPDSHTSDYATRSDSQAIGETKYTRKQIERLKYLIKTLGCCRSNHIAKKYIQMVWMKVPERRGGGLGLGLDIDSIIHYIRRSIYGNDKTGRTTQRKMKRFKAWATRQPESRALPQPSRSTASPSRYSTLIDLTMEEKVGDSIEASPYRTATTPPSIPPVTTPTIQAPVAETTSPSSASLKVSTTCTHQVPIPQCSNPKESLILLQQIPPARLLGYGSAQMLTLSTTSP